MSLDQFAHDLAQDVLASAEADSLSTHDAFAERVLGDLEMSGQIDDWNLGYYRSRGIEISGYGFNPDLASVELFLVHFRQAPLESKIGAKELGTLAKRLAGFLPKLEELISSLEDESEVRDMALAVKDALPSVSRVRLFVITNDVSTTSKTLKLDPVDGLPLQLEVWDLARLHRLATSGVLHEPIEVEFEQPLPCLSTPTTDSNYSVFLTIIPGDVLAAVYKEFGARLLELNVRAFLQTKGAVNRGIRETLLHSPERFLAYNNGISATASKIKMVQLPDHAGYGISKISDLQIVNGGQTTASLHNALAKDECDLSKVFVQAKLTVVEPRHLAEIVPEISKFSNTQNKVTVVDFSSNDPFHVELEKITRTLWAAAPPGTSQESKWFYERARGQYADALARERTPAKQRAFKIQYPLKQKFLKTDVAKWENSWSQQPWLVSRGAEKNFRAFMAELGGATPTSDLTYVQRLLAKGVLFRSAERIVTQENFGGYRANIVTYTIAKLCNSTAQRIDLDRIWREQSLSDALTTAIQQVSRLVAEVVFNPRGTTHVGEWTKKEACWAQVVEASWTVPKALEKELLTMGVAKAQAKSEAAAGLTKDQADAVAQVAGVSADTWFAISNWARETGNLQPWQRSLAFSLGRVVGRGADPSVKQAAQGVKILDSAVKLGFKL